MLKYIPLTHKYTQRIKIKSAIKIGALEMQLLAFSSISADYLQKI